MNKNFIKKAVVGAGLGLSLILPLIAMAATSVNPQPIIVSSQGIDAIIVSILNWMSAILFTIALIMLLYAAFLYMTAGASEAALGKSKTVLIYAVVGIAVAILSYSVQPFLERFLRGTF